jgi:cobalt-zinc-cadmium efflux system outer membrane protein
LCLLAGLLSGCAGVDPRPAFVDVQKRVAERTGQSPSWVRTAAEAAEVDRALQALLQGELTIESALRIALVNNRALQGTFEELGVSQADFAQSTLIANPAATALARFPHAGPAGTNLELGLIEDVMSLFTQPLRKKIGAAELEETKLRVGHEVLTLAADVKVAYFSLLARQQLVERLREAAQVDAAAAEFAEKQHAAGTLSALDLAAHRATFNQSKVAVAIEETRVRSDRERLDRLLGLWGPATRWAVSARLPDLPAEDPPLAGLESRAMAQRLDLGAARARVDLVGRALALKRGTRYLPVGLDLGVATEKDPDGAWLTGPALSLQLPVFDTGKPAIARLLAQHRQAQRRLEALAIDARSEVREAWTLMQSARDLCSYYREVLLPERAEILDLTLKEHNMMLKGAYELLQAKQSEVATQRAYLDAWKDYWIARTELERALGGSL